MNTSEAVEIVRQFWIDGELTIPAGVGVSEKQRIESEFVYPFPLALTEYIEKVVPVIDNIIFKTVGNPMVLYCAVELGIHQEDFSHDGMTGDKYEDWKPNWFLFADEGMDPVIIDLENNEGKILKAIHGSGEWNFDVIADSLGQFLLCLAAKHHALVSWGDDCTTDDENGFNLSPDPAEWFFPRMKEWAGSYFESWCEEFDNRDQ